jgi:hypothetical protein
VWLQVLVVLRKQGAQTMLWPSTTSTLHQSTYRSCGRSWKGMQVRVGADKAGWGSQAVLQ